MTRIIVRIRVDFSNSTIFFIYTSVSFESVLRFELEPRNFESLANIMNVSNGDILHKLFLGRYY